MGVVFFKTTAKKEFKDEKSSGIYNSPNYYLKKIQPKTSHPLYF